VTRPASASVNSKPNGSVRHVENSANQVLGKTPTFDGGTKRFTVALKPGTYTYYCSVPGHRQPVCTAR
jgi:hypothetical protein